MKIKLIFNGFRHGHIYGLYRKAIENDNVSVVGCIETNDEARAEASYSLGIEFSKKSYEEWLNTDIDAVAVGNAYGERGKIIIAALKAGKHVIADKPICTSLDELEEIAQLSKEKGLVVTCMLDLRYLAQTKTAKKIIDSKELGEVRNISFGGQHYLDYGHRPEWYYEKGMHGGTINDLAIHGIDLLRFLTGMEITTVDAARVWNSYATEQADFKDSAVFMARLENGASILADISYSAPSQVFSMPTYWEFRFWCEKGMMTFSYADDKVTIYKDGDKIPIIADNVPYGDDWLCDFIRQIEKNDIATTEHTLKSCETALKIQMIADNNRE